MQAAALPTATTVAANQVQGRIETVTLSQTRLGVPKSFKVYLPPDYPKRGPYPTLYLLRGTMAEWLNPQQDESRKGRTAVSVYETLRRQGQVGDMILVFPGLGSDDGQWPGILSDWVAPNGAQGVGNGCFEAFFFEDLIPAVDGRFQTLKTATHRAIDGFSLGGWASVQAAVSHPGTFASVGAYDGTYPLARTAETIQETDEIWREGFFDPVFGQPRQWPRIAASSPANRLWQDRGDLSGIQWLIERCPAHTPYSDCARTPPLEARLAEHRVLSRLGILPGGRHDWWHADEHLTITLPLHWQRIRPSQP